MNKKRWIIGFITVLITIGVVFAGQKYLVDSQNNAEILIRKSKNSPKTKEIDEVELKFVNENKLIQLNNSSEFLQLARSRAGKEDKVEYEQLSYAIAENFKEKLTSLGYININVNQGPTGSINISGNLFSRNKIKKADKNTRNLSNTYFIIKVSEYEDQYYIDIDSYQYQPITKSYFKNLSYDSKNPDNEPVFPKFWVVDLNDFSQKKYQIGEYPDEYHINTFYEGMPTLVKQNGKISLLYNDNFDILNTLRKNDDKHYEVKTAPYHEDDKYIEDISLSYSKKQLEDIENNMYLPKDD